MIQKFNFFHQYESPTFILCNPDKSQISAFIANNRSINLKFNDVSEISFDISDKYQDEFGVTQDFFYYDLFQGKRLILVENIGYFVIQSVSENDDYYIKTKSIVAYSAQYTLANKKNDIAAGTYKFYDAVDNSNTITGKIMAQIPAWSLGSVDSELSAKYRTFDLEDVTIYDFIINNVSSAYECVFVFDYLNYTIDIKIVENLVYSTDIYLSFRNLMKNIKINEQTDQIVTCLSVYGQDLDIRGVNPLGSNSIYDFTYYKDIKWMTQDLINAITAWENLVTSNQSTYAGYLTSLRTKRGELATLNSDLATIEGNIDVEEGVRSVRIEQGLPIVDNTTTINNLLSQKSAKESAISAKQAEIDSVLSNMSEINTALSFENNFTEAQLLALDKYIIQSDYSNNTYIITDLMTPAEIQTYTQELYNEGVEVLGRLSQPRYTFSIDGDNFIFLEDYKTFTDQLDLGRIINVEKDETTIFRPILLEIDFSWDSPEDFNLKFGNRYKLDDDAYTFTDLLAQSISSTSKTDRNWSSLTKFTSDYEDDVSDFINNALDVGQKTITSSANQDMKWDASGLLLRKWNSDTSTFEDEQTKMINNGIYMTRDNWNTVSAVLGNISLSGGGTAYGLVADILVGRIVAANTLIITNNVDAELSTFTVDGTGATLTNATFTVVRGKQRVMLDPTNGIKIQKNTSVTSTPVWTDQLYADANGNLIMVGKITASDGAIGGYTIGTNTLSSGSVGLYSGTTYKYTSGVAANSIRIYAGAELQATTDTSGIPFVIDEYGRLKASSAYVSGVITMSSGSKIGNWVVTENSIYNVKSSFASTAIGVYIGTDGINLGGVTDYFKVSSAGVLNATSANISGTVSMGSGSKIGNWNVGLSSIYNAKSSYSSATQGIYIGTDGISLGGSTTYFKVTNAGSLDVASGSIKGSSIYGANYYSFDGNSQMTLSDILVSGNPLGCGLVLYRAGGNIGFQISSITTNTQLYGFGGTLFLTHTGTTFPEGTWNFQFATVTHLPAKFA